MLINGNYIYIYIYHRLHLHWIFVWEKLLCFSICQGKTLGFRVKIFPGATTLSPGSGAGLDVSQFGTQRFPRTAGAAWLP